MEELAYQMVQQFFTSMKSHIELVLSEGSSFEFARMLLENQIENIHYTESPTQARTYMTLVRQLGICLRELKTLEKASSMDEARSTLSKLLACNTPLPEYVLSYVFRFFDHIFRFTFCICFVL